MESARYDAKETDCNSEDTRTSFWACSMRSIQEGRAPKLTAEFQRLFAARVYIPDVDGAVRCAGHEGMISMNEADGNRAL